MTEEERIAVREAESFIANSDCCCESLVILAKQFLEHRERAQKLTEVLKTAREIMCDDLVEEIDAAIGEFGVA